jgi:YD repeat-containing protein
MSGLIEVFNAGHKTLRGADNCQSPRGREAHYVAYGRDNANQLTSDSSIPSSSGSYQYNTLNQLCYAGSSTRSACSSPPRGAIPYAYDAADNLTQTGSTQQTFNNAGELCWTAASSGACASPPSGATTYAYDTRGNRTTVTPPAGAATNLSYDQANRLTAYASIAAYAYNGDGLRMSKTVSGITSQFLWDVAPAVPLLLKDGSTAYVYGPGALPFEQINGSTVLWLHHDQLGSTRLVTDTTGASQATYTFDPYGNITASTGTITNPLRFAGQYRDGESSLYYLRARNYDPATGVLSRIVTAPSLISESIGLASDVYFDRVKNVLLANGESICDEGVVAPKLGHFAKSHGIDAGDMKFPGVHANGSIDWEW